jgi:hypothetical protein
MRLRTYAATILLTAMTLAACGCGASAPEYAFDPVEKYSVSPPTFKNHVYAARGRNAAEPATAPGDQPPRTDKPQVLVLSGGGSNGAWGAGFLVGWGRTPTRPKFDVVTGVSTGALIATGAFLGDDQFLTEAFTTTSNVDVQDDKWWIQIPFSDSVRSTGPLAKTLERFFTDALIDRVGAEAARDRKLYIASTDLDTGRLVIWDLTRVAADHQYVLYRQLVLSSASAPVLYPPVRIGKDLFVDGGIRASLFYRTYLLAPDLKDAKPQIYAINNGAIGIATEAHLEDAIIPIGLQSLQCLLDANGNDSLLQLSSFGDVKFSYIPTAAQALTSFDFDLTKMNELFQAGVRNGAGQVWQAPPNPDETPATSLMTARP